MRSPVGSLTRPGCSNSAMRSRQASNRGRSISGVTGCAGFIQGMDFQPTISARTASTRAGHSAACGNASAKGISRLT
jgi:hypothetical protein